ncbi:MAG: Gfo/Idh/MocA family oxidoreductase [Anaerolineae bacterium]|nr:Gfo/Idh/MocA family oxidoreductase [Anaerolineae bacterium]
MTDKIRWGILGTGNIAHKFAEGLSAVSDAVLVAVGSRTQKSADEFGSRFAAPRRYASYEALAADAEVDAIYISTPHPFHKENALLCLEAGKAVLCEKPFALNAVDAQQMMATAKANHVFLMEAMWMRFIPAILKTRELLQSGAIGDVLMLQADFGFRLEFDPASRLYNPALGGGALLDVGIYPLTLAYLFFGEPDSLSSEAVLGRTGTDDLNAMVLKYAGGRLAQLSSAVSVETPCEALFFGTKGSLKIHFPFWASQKLTLRVGGKTDVMEVPMVGNGYNYEAEEVGRCLRAGKIESERCPHAETLAIMRQMDSMRAAWGLKYPGE